MLTLIVATLLTTEVRLYPHCAGKKAVSKNELVDLYSNDSPGKGKSKIEEDCRVATLLATTAQGKVKARIKKNAASLRSSQRPIYDKILLLK